MPRLLLVVLVLAVCGCFPVVAAASETVSLQTSFSPDRLGASTTIGFGFHIGTTNGEIPPPLTHVDLHLPAGINYISTTLGLAICKPASLLARGAEGCPVNSKIGFGSAFVELPFGDGVGGEIPEIEAFMGPPNNNGNLVVLFYTVGQTPVSAQLLFQGELSAGFGSSGGSLVATVPLVPSLPGGSDVSIVRVQATIGPSHLLYVEHVHGKTVHFRPRGVAVPERCPRGGFPFSAEFVFEDGSQARASSVVACPARRR
jgi:hypothetical protein